MTFQRNEEKERKAKEVQVAQDIARKEQQRLMNNERSRRYRHMQKQRKYQLDREAEENELQRRLFNDPRRTAVQQVWREAPSNTPMADLSIMAEIMFQGTPASCSGPSKIYSLVDAKQLPEHLRSTEPPDIIILHDQEWFNGRPKLTSDEFIRKAEENRGQVLDVQDPSLPGPLVSNHMSTRDVAKRWRESGGRVSRTPMNLLNLSCKTEGLLPPGMANYCSLLTEACQAVENGVLANVRGKRTWKEYRSAVDLESRISWMIGGQAGSGSIWHLDDISPITWGVSEGNYDSEKDDEGVLKCWAVVDLRLMTNDHRNAVLEDFARLGPKWQPDPRWVRVFSLTRGRAIILRGGRGSWIHGVLNATDCLFRGGMCWDKRFFVSHHLPGWVFISQNRDQVTNEDPAAQVGDVVKWVELDFGRHLDQYRISKAELPKARNMCKEVKKNSRPCKCEESGSRNCPCAHSKFQCFPSCKCFRSCHCSYDV